MRFRGMKLRAQAMDSDHLERVGQGSLDAVIRHLRWEHRVESWYTEEHEWERRELLEAHAASHAA